MERDIEEPNPLSVSGFDPNHSGTPGVVLAATQFAENTTTDADMDRPGAASPHIAVVDSLWSRSARLIVLGIILLAGLVYVLFGSVLARNVTYNMSRSIDPGAKNGIPRYSRETIASIWQTMWDKAPDFGSVDAIRIVLLVATLLFFMAFAAIIMLIFVPARQEWTASFGESQESE